MPAFVAVAVGCGSVTRVCRKYLDVVAPRCSAVTVGCVWSPRVWS